MKIGGHFVVLKEKLYRYLGLTAGIAFNLLNVLLGGNLPPFGSACVIVKRDEQYLLLELRNGKLCLSGGFVRWHEDPAQTAVRECREETGLEVRVLDQVGCFFSRSDAFNRMSTLTMVYSAEIIGGHEHQALEGRPAWFSEAATRQRLDSHYQPFFAGYLRYYEQHALPTSGANK